MHDEFIKSIKQFSHPLDAKPTGERPVLPQLDGIKAVLFDVYGTCVISGSGDIGVAMSDSKADALVQALADQGRSVTLEEAEDGLKEFHALIAARHAWLREQGVEYPEVRILDIWESWRRERNLPLDVRQLAIGYECRVNPVWPMPGVLECWAALKARTLALGIVSNAQVFTPCLFPALLGKSLEEMGAKRELCVWSWMLEEAKPSTQPYELVLHPLREEHGILPENVLYVGNDMRNDITPASQVGMKTALFAGDARSLRWREGDELVGRTRPDAVVTDLRQVPDVIA